jgi:hypothetical protein
MCKNGFENCSASCKKNPPTQGMGDIIRAIIGIVITSGKKRLKKRLK